MEEEIREELEICFQKIIKLLSSQNKTDEEIGRILKNDISSKLNRVKNQLKETNSMTIKEAEGKRAKYKNDIDKLNIMLELFDEEFEKYMYIYHYKQRLSEKLKDRRERLSDLRVNIGTQTKSTKTILEEIKRQARAKYPIMEEK